MAEGVVPSRRSSAVARRRMVAAIIGSVLVAAIVLAALTFTPLFGAREIRVEGTVSLTREDASSLAGIEEGTNVFHLDTAGAERAIEADPWVEDATVVRDLPTTIVVRIVEREPVIIADGAALAADGTVLPGADARGLPTIQVVGGSSQPADLEAAAAAAGAMTAAVRRRVGAILVEPDDDLVLRLADGVTVYYGEPAEHAAKAEALRALLRWVEEKGVTIESVDVSVPTAPTARPVGAASTSVP